MKRQKGFTLIELVVVIVILGILAVTAAPKFLDIQDEAKTSALYGLTGGMRGALAMTYAQAIVEGKSNLPTSNSEATIEVEGNTVNLDYGYPESSDDLKKIVTGLDEWKEKPTITGITTSSYVTYYGFNGFNCLVGYEKATAISTGGTIKYTPGKVTLVGSDCKRVN